MEKISTTAINVRPGDFVIIDNNGTTAMAVKVVHEFTSEEMVFGRAEETTIHFQAFSETNEKKTWIVKNPSDYLVTFYRF